MRRKPIDVLCGIESQLIRISDLLEGILESTDPLKKWEGYASSESEPPVRAFYTDEEQMIVQERLAALGKEYKPRK